MGFSCALKASARVIAHVRIAVANQTRRLFDSSMATFSFVLSGSYIYSNSKVIDWFAIIRCDKTLRLRSFAHPRDGLRMTRRAERECMTARRAATLLALADAMHVGCCGP